MKTCYDCKYWSSQHCYECDIGYCEWWEEFVYGYEDGIPSMDNPCKHFKEKK